MHRLMHIDHLREAYFELFCVGLIVPLPKETFFKILDAFAVLSRRPVNRIYRSSFAVVARGRPCPGRRPACPVPWNRFHSLTMILISTPIAEANPQVYVETPLHPEKLTVWCALWAGGIIGPYFFKNDEGHNVTVNGDRYRAMITNFFIPELNNHDVQELWFQRDGATCHTARATID
ncbi:DUF4817 domain-containing protein [Trichonephila clavipes]|nr:DUF4817 domain-containing protein [Trichonephila clavipes]